jgi:hypothetical protein
MQKKKTFSDLLPVAFTGMLVAALIPAQLRIERRNGTTACQENGTVGVLFPCGKAIGQAYSRTQTGIRMVKVDSYSEAYGFFLSLCDTNAIRTLAGSPYKKYVCPLPDLKGSLLFTDSVPARTHETAVLHVACDSVNRRGIREIHFVETVKPNRRSSPGKWLFRNSIRYS